MSKCCLQTTPTNHTPSIRSAMRPVVRLSDTEQGDASYIEETRVLEPSGAPGGESPVDPVIAYPPEQYIALEELEFGWDKQLLPQVKQWWQEGVPGWEIAERLKRDQDEVAILLMSMRREVAGSPITIKDRPGGWFGSAAGSGVYTNTKDKRKIKK